jgi:hypothetical protein
MKIERGNANAYRLSSLSKGTAFEYNNALYLKTSYIVNDMRTCVRLEDGYVEWFEEDVFVYKYEAKVVVK